MDIEAQKILEEVKVYIYKDDKRGEYKEEL